MLLVKAFSVLQTNTYPVYLFIVKTLQENTYFREGCHGGKDATHPAIRFFNTRNKHALPSHYLISNLKIRK